MQRLLDNPDEARRLGAVGYLQSDDANIPDLDSHINAIENIYRKFA